MVFNADNPLKVAIIGAGPSGFYSLEALQKAALQEDGIPVQVDLFEKLPTPYGLVRFGVAPDHPKIKSVTKLYSKALAQDNARYFGGVTLGKDIMLEDLREHYDAIIYTVGASSDRSLGIAGEDLPNSISATQFVAWYNGHPDKADYQPDLSVKSVAVIGMGNVAVDVTRILAKSADELASTDMADHALAALREAQVEDIYMIARRGPAQAKFTTKELRELGELLHADIVVDSSEVEIDEVSQPALETKAIAKNVSIMQAMAAKAPEGKARRVHLRFFRSPVEILGEEKVTGIKLERTRLEQQGDYLAAVKTGETEVLEVGMVLRSVGYRGVPLSDVPFDSKRAIIPNTAGRVQEEDGTVRLGEYTAGWIKRGPQGVIGTNKACATESVRCLLEDVTKLQPAPQRDPDAIKQLLVERDVRVIDFKDWQKLEQLEQATGKAQGRPAVKFVDVAEMLRQLDT